jgi:hypothetical protein
VTRDELMRLFSYDPIHGVFVWRQTRAGGNNAGFIKARPGEIAGRIDATTGYVRIRTHGRTIYAHRLAWLFVHGVWPSLHIDHINGRKADNRIENLRDVSRSVNLQNRHGPSKKNRSTGVLGVSLRNGRFVASIRIGGKTTNLGRFDTAEAAHAAYLSAKRRVHDGCTI